MGKDPFVVQFDLHSYTFMVKVCKEAEYAIEILHPDMGFKIVKIRKRRHTNVKKSEYQDTVNLKEGRLAECVRDGTHSCESSVESSVIATFHKLVSKGPDYVCSFCTQTFFKHSVRNSETLSDDIKRQFLSNFLSIDGYEWVCLACWKSLKKGKTPKFWLHNGLQFPNKPIELELSSLEERLVSPRLPFMQLSEMPRGGQLNMRGNVVNVPADINSTIKSLPRLVNDDETIMLKLKRRLSYKHHVAFENIHPNKVFEAAKWLVSNSALFRSEGIEINETWLQQPEEMFMKENDKEPSSQERNADLPASTQSDCWTEDENFNDRPTGNFDTCLQSMDFREFNQV